MLNKIVFSLFILVFFTSMVSGQIATPSLDQSIPVKAGTATPWRYFDSAGVYHFITSGEEKTADVKSSDFEGTTTGGNAVLFFDMFGFEVDLLSKLDFNYTGINAVTGDRDIDISKQKIYLTYRFGEQFAIAVESIKGSKKKDIEKTGTSKTKETERIKTGLGASLRFAGPFFVAFGIREVKATGSGEDNSVSYTLNSNSWRESYYGIAILTGAPGENQLRLEYSVVSSPETKKSGDCSNCGNHHQKTENTFAAAEVKLGDWLFRYQTETATESDLSFKAGTTEESTVSTVIGIAFIQESGFTLGVYQTAAEKTGKLNGSDIKQSDTGTAVTLGFVF